MYYFSKRDDEGRLLITTLDDNSGVVVLSGDYILIWDIIKLKEDVTPLEKEVMSVILKISGNQSLKILSNFLNFLIVNKLYFDASDKDINQLLSLLQKKSELKGEFNNLDITDSNLSVAAAGFRCVPEPPWDSGPYDCAKNTNIEL